MSVPGNIAEMSSARTVDTAMNAMKMGQMLSGTQLANAERAMQKLIGPDTALLYGVLSGGLEVATEKMFDGIPGSKGGWLNNWPADYAETNMGRAALKAAKDSVGEGLEEFTSGMVQPYLAKMWKNDAAI